MPSTQPDGYLAMPPSGSGSAVLVLHAWWGLNATIRAICDRLAAAGFVAFAPDLYHGQVTDTIPGAEALSNALDADRAKADVAAAAAFLGERAGQAAGGLAVMGFSLGAYFALNLSIAQPAQVHSVVLFYGSGPGDFGQARAAYLGHFAEADPYEPQEYADELEAALHRAGRPMTFYRYPGTQHWFFEPDRNTFNPAAASLAWERTLAFLRRSST